jgi:hypothetical protein
MISFTTLALTDTPPKHALQRTPPSRCCCNRGVPWAGSLSLSRSPPQARFRRQVFKDWDVPKGKRGIGEGGMHRFNPETGHV